MNMKIASMAAALALFGFVAAANAGEAVSLNAAQMDGVTAGADPSRSFDFSKWINIHETVNKYVNKQIYADADIFDNIAEGEAVATCSGFDCLAETLTVTDTTPFSGTAYSSSLSATD